MKTGIFYWFGYRSPLAERFRMIASAGFDNVLLWWGDQFSEDDGPAAERADLARKTGLYVENIHTDFENANSFWTDNQTGLAVFDRYMKNVDDCRTHEIPAMVVHLSSGDEMPQPPDNLGLDRVKRLAEKAERNNVIIAIENMRITGPLDFVFRNVDSPNLKLCYDSGHENCLKTKHDILDNYGHRLAALHLHDNDGLTDQHTIPGEGNINWQLLINKLKKCNFAGSITLEADNNFPEKYKSYTAEQFLQSAYAEAKKIADQF